MIGTYLIAIVGYGLTSLLAYESAAFALRSIFIDGLDGQGSGISAVGAGVCAIIIATATRWLTGGAL